MARAAKKAPARAQKSSPPTKRGASQKSAPAKRGAQKGRRRKQELEASQSWFGALDTLARSPLGREILADVLEAAAVTIRNRPQVITQAIDAGMEAVSNVAGSTTDAVQKAASALADMASSLIPSPSALSAGDESNGRKRRGGPKAGAKKRR